MKFISELLEILFMQKIAFPDPHLHKFIKTRYTRKIQNKTETNREDNTHSECDFQQFLTFSNFQILRYENQICVKDVPRILLIRLKHFGNS